MLFAVREIALFKAKPIGIGAHIRNRDKVNAGAHIAIVQLHNELVAVNGELFRENAEDVQMPAVCGVVRDEGWFYAVNFGKFRVVLFGDFQSLRLHFV